SARSGREIKFNAIHLVSRDQFLEHRELMITNLGMGDSPAAVSYSELRIHSTVTGHANAGEEIHTPGTRSVPEHRERIKSTVDETLHVLPDTPVSGEIERLHVRAEPLSHLGRVE